jgi:DNA-binding MarR family transcriptional regulator
MSSPSHLTADPALRLAQRFQVFAQVFRRWIRSHVADDGVSPARLRLLGVLHCQGPLTMSHLGEELGVTARNVTTLVDALEREGLVRRTPHPTDRRATVIDLTPAGAARAAVLVDTFTEQIAGLFRELPRTDQRELLRLVDALIAALQERGPNGRGG